MVDGGQRSAVSSRWSAVSGRSISLILTIGGLRIRLEHVRNLYFAPVGSVIRQTPTLTLMTLSGRWTAVRPCP
ncbi:MAG: hypothetical protein ABIG63_11005 [Chloroflexota bacterium]